MELNAYANLPALLLLNDEREKATRLLTSWSFIKRAAEIGALEQIYKTACSFQLDHVSDQLRTILSKMATLADKAESFAQFVAEEALDNLPLAKMSVDDFRGNEFLLAEEESAPDLAICSTRKPKRMLRVATDTYLTVDHRNGLTIQEN